MPTAGVGAPRTSCIEEMSCTEEPSFLPGGSLQLPGIGGELAASQGQATTPSVSHHGEKSPGAGVRAGTPAEATVATTVPVPAAPSTAGKVLKGVR